MGFGATSQPGYLLLSRLEHAAVRPRSAQDYKQALQILVDFCRENNYNWTTVVQLDIIVVLLFEVLYDEGFGVGVGKKIHSGLGHFIPELFPSGIGRLPRTVRALQGWNQLRPPAQRLPIPRFVALNIAAVLAANGQAPMAAWVMITFSAYLRPSETMRLTAASLVPPVPKVCDLWAIIVSDWHQGIAGKTGIFDESILVTDQFLYPVLQGLKLARQGSATLWSFTMEQLRTAFQSACVRLGAGGSHLYGLRHGGVSHDLLHRILTQAEAQRKGRWASMRSMRRYAKESRLLAEMHKVNLELVQSGEQILSHFSDVVSGAFKPGIPSGTLKTAPQTGAKSKRVKTANLRRRDPG